MSNTRYDALSRTFPPTIMVPCFPNSFSELNFSNSAFDTHPLSRRPSLLFVFDADTIEPVLRFVNPQLCGNRHFRTRNLRFWRFRGGRADRPLSPCSPTESQSCRQGIDISGPS